MRLTTRFVVFLKCGCCLVPWLVACDDTTNTADADAGGSAPTVTGGGQPSVPDVGPPGAGGQPPTGTDSSESMDAAASQPLPQSQRDGASLPATESDATLAQLDADVPMLDASIDPEPEIVTPDASVQVKQVFITESSYTGALGGLLGADAICQDLAEAANLSGTFRAWLSSIAQSASLRLTHSTLPYARTDGVWIANDWDDLIDGQLAAPLNVSEAQTIVNSDAWTGTLSDGTPWLTSDCSGFSVETVAETAACGSSTATDSQWTTHLYPNCFTPLHLYCIEQ